MNLRRGPRVPGGRANFDRSRRSPGWIVLVALILAGCGSVGGPSPTPSPTTAPSITASPAPTASPEPTASPSATTAGGGGKFAFAGLSPVIDKPAQAVDTSTFTTTFASETPAIYALYKLEPGTSGKVVLTWRQGGAVINTFSLDYPAEAPWAYFELTFKNGFIPGESEVVLTVLDTEDTVTLPFTITGPRKPPAAPTPVPSGTSAFTLLSMATFADSTKSAPDATKFTETFTPSAPKLYVVFALRPGLAGTVVCNMTANGEKAVEPITLTYSTGNSWGDFEISSGGTFPIGDYEATLTFEPSGEVVTIPFTVN